MKPLIAGVVFCSLVGLGVQATAVVALWMLFFYAVISGVVLRIRAV